MTDTAKHSALICGMDNKASVIEVSCFGGKVLVTFSDGTMAIFEAAQIRHLALQVKALIPLPVALRG
jgi:hypothetical protein